MIRFSDAAKTARHEAIAARLRRGSIAIYEGRRPDSADDPSPFSPIVVMNASAAVITPSPLGFKVEGLPVAKADRAGKAAWFRCLDEAGKPICDGTIGQDKVADMRLDNPQFWPGVELEIAEFDIRAKVA